MLTETCHRHIRRSTRSLNSIAPFTITICGIQELAGHSERGVSHVLSILDPDWPVPEAFGQFGEHAKLELRFHDVIDEGVPTLVAPRPSHVADLLAFGRDILAEPPGSAHLLVHCHAGVSRSTASMALILAQALPDTPAPRIMEAVLHIRPQAWPNLRIVEMGDALLRRDGTLVEATRKLYQTQLRRQPHLADEMRWNGREREVALAEG